MRFSMKNWLAPLCALTLAAYAACERAPTSRTEPGRLSITLLSWVGYGPFYLAAQKGFFAEEGLDLVFVDEELDAARRDAFQMGMLDAEAATIDTLVNKRAADTPVVAVAVLDFSLGGDAIVAVDEIRTLQDLVGKRVALARDDVGETFLGVVLHEAGIALTDVTIVPVSPERAAQAFLDGNAAAVTWEPWVSRALARKGAHVLMSTRDKPGIIVDVLSVRETVVRQHPKLVEALIRGWYRAVAFCQTHPEESAAVIAPFFRLSAAQYTEQVRGLRWPGCEEASQYLGDGAQRAKSHEVFDAISLLKQKTGRIALRPDATEAIHPEILRKVCEHWSNAN